MRYSTLEPKKTLVIIIPIWIMSGLLFLPDLIYFKQIIWQDEFSLDNTSIKICFAEFPSKEANHFYVLIVSISLGFICPLMAITACYVYIYTTIVKRPTFAVDKNAVARDQRVKLKVTHMMVTVVILFAASWFPFYCFWVYIMYNEESLNLPSVQVIRAMLQWLVLANSCINPILYAYFSRKFLRAFREILVLPCRKRYNQLKSYTKSTRHRTARIRSQISETVMSRVTLMGGARRGTDDVTTDGCSGNSRANSCWTAADDAQQYGNTTAMKPDLASGFNDADNSAPASVERVKRKLLDTALLIRSRLEDEVMYGGGGAPSSRMSVQLSERPLPNSRSSAASLYDKCTGRPLVIRNSEIISESSSEDEIIEPGMIALSLVTLPCLLATGRRSNDSSATLPPHNTFLTVAGQRRRSNDENGALPNNNNNDIDALLNKDVVRSDCKESGSNAHARHTSVPTNL